MIKIIRSSDLSSIKKYLHSRNIDCSEDTLTVVKEIIERVKNKGDDSLFEYTKKFDNIILDTLEVSKNQLHTAAEQVSPEFKKDLLQAKENIEFFHTAQKRNGFHLEKEDGIFLGQRIMPLQRVGVYVPGGRAAYPSTVLMNVIPAKVAGVSEVIMVSPPASNFGINPYIAAAAIISGVDKVYKVGGAQAVAALAYGTETIKKVDKIIGPGNIFVAQAKRLVYGQVDIDMIAGPSEILVIADSGADPRYIAADLISQAEHDPLASSIFITTDKALVDKVVKELKTQTVKLPKADIIKKSLTDYGIAIVCDTIEECFEISNQIAPEHLEIMMKEPMEYLGFVKNAGSVFLGYYTCEAIGDYFGGTNHVLPTNGTARFFSALSIDDFVKKSSYLHWTKTALQKYGGKIINIAHHEMLEGHGNAVKVRLEDE